MSKLFEENDSDSDLHIKTDTNFAKNYNTWRQKEELHKLQTRYKDVEDSDSSSSSDDDEANEVDEKFEKDFLKTLSFLKHKDPRIYDKDFQFFDKSEESGEKTPKKRKTQPMYIKDYERNLILEKGGQLSDDEEEGTLPEKSKTYVEEQEELKENLKEVLKNVDEEEDSGDWGGIFKTRQKTVQEEKKEEEDYLQWLAGQKEHLKDENAENELKPLKEYWTNPKLNEDEKFLRDYLLKKKFLEREDDDDYIPTYDEIVHDSDKDLSEDEKAISVQEEFEHKYNFRFEEPDKEFIKRYPRTIEHSLRQKDDKRITKRLETKERKLQEKKQKMEELEQLKTLKRAEIEEKIKKLQEITGNTEIGFDFNDVDGDFDPEEHDKRMQRLFDDEFYQEPEGEKKPEFPEIDEELELENWDYWHGNEDQENSKNGKSETNEPHCEDEDFNMDCDYDPAKVQQELIDNTKRRNRRKRKSKFATLLSQPKPVFDPNDKTYQEYLDEYYKLDCEDIIGDIPCRFKYRKVVPNSFGLSIEEILTAKDRELNKWCSLKKTVQHRPEHVEKYDVIAFEKKGQNINLKRKCLPSLFTEETTEADKVPLPSTSMNPNSTINTSPSNTENQTSVQNKKRKRKNQEKPINNIHANNSDETEKKANDETVEEKQKPVVANTTNKKKKKKQKTNQSSEKDNEEKQVNNNNLDSTTQNSVTKKQKKRKMTETIATPSIIKRFKKGKQQSKQPATPEISDARLTAFGINPKRFKNKQKYGSVK